MFTKIIQVSIVSIMFLFSVSILTANADRGHIVKTVYFVPKDRVFKKDVFDKLSIQIHQTQQFYADQMEFHGYGRMTFEYEKDNFGRPLVQHVVGEFDDAYYHHDTVFKVLKEIRDRFHDVDRNIYIISVDVSTGFIGGYCGKALYDGGPAFVPSTGDCVRDDDVINLISHELGHALNLNHDFRDLKFIMGRGGPQRRGFSECAAVALSVNHFLNEVHTHRDTKGQITMLTSDTYTIDHREQRVKFKVSDPDKLHQAFLEYITPSNDLAGISGCVSIANKIEAEISFDMPHDAIKSQKTHIWLHAFDVNGHKTTSEHELTGIQKIDLGFTYIALEYNTPNSLVPINPQVDWGWDWGGWEHYWERKPDEDIPPRPHQGYAHVWNIPFEKQWKHWFYAHDEGKFVYDLTLTEKDHRVFDAYLYLPNPCGNRASIDMICKADNVEIYRTGVVKFAQAQNKHIKFVIPENTKEFTIEIDDAGDNITCDHYIIANAKLIRFEPEEEPDEDETDEDETDEEAIKDPPKSINAKSKLVLTWAKIKSNRN